MTELPSVPPVLHHVLTAAALVFERDVAPDDNFFDLGGDSIAAVELITQLEQRLDIEVDPQLVTGLPDVGSLADALAAVARAGDGLLAPEGLR